MRKVSSTEVKTGAIRRLAVCLVVAGALVAAGAAVANDFTLNPTGAPGNDVQRHFSAAGTWTFTVTALSGKVNELFLAIRQGAGFPCPPSGDIVWYERVKRPAERQSFTAEGVPAGEYCVVSSILGGNKGGVAVSATISVTHP